MEHFCNIFPLVFATECEQFCAVLPLLMLLYQRQHESDQTKMAYLMPVMELIHMVYLGLDNNITMQQMQDFVTGVHHVPSINLLMHAQNRIYRTMETHFSVAGWEVANILQVPANRLLDWPWQPQLRKAMRLLMNWANFHDTIKHFDDAWSCLRSTVAIAKEVKALCLTCKSASILLQDQLRTIKNCIDQCELPYFFPFLIRMERFNEARLPFWPELACTKEAFIQALQLTDPDCVHELRLPWLPFEQAFTNNYGFA
jgi:hypothetical protein